MTSRLAAAAWRRRGGAVEVAEVEAHGGDADERVDAARQPHGPEAGVQNEEGEEPVEQRLMAAAPKRPMSPGGRLPPGAAA